MLKDFSERSLEVCLIAIDSARSLGCSKVSAEHILLGLASSKLSLVSMPFKSQNITSSRVKQEMTLADTASANQAILALPFSTEARDLILMCEPMRLSTGIKHDYILTSHLAIAGLNIDSFIRILSKLEINIDDLKTSLVTTLSDQSNQQTCEQICKQNWTRQQALDYFASVARKHKDWRPFLMTRMHFWNITEEEVLKSI